jgi:phage terminase Nu1 subunit (DNA packaging protein)
VSENRFLLKAVEISKILGVSDRTISRWSNQGEVIKQSRGTYCLVSVFKRYRRLLLEQIASSQEKIDLANNNSVKKSLIQEKLESSIKIIILHAQIKEYELKIKEGNLVDRAEAERVYREAWQEFRAIALKLPEELAPQIAQMKDPSEINDLLEKRVNELLACISVQKSCR